MCIQPVNVSIPISLHTLFSYFAHYEMKTLSLCTWNILASWHHHLNIIEVIMYAGICMYVSRVLDRQLINCWCHGHQNRRLCSCPHSRESVIFFVFLGLILFKLRLVCWIHYETSRASPAGGARERRARSVAIGRNVLGCHYGKCEHKRI